MTWYYSPEIAGRLISSAEESLQKMRGQTLTREQLYKLFGPFDQSGDSCAENRDAFKAVLKSGLLIKETPELWRVALVPNKDAAQRVEEATKAIDVCLQKAAEEIEKIVMEEVGRVGDCFPQTIFGVLDGKKHGVFDVKEMEKANPAIMLDGHCHITWHTYVVLMSDGIWGCPRVTTGGSGGIQDRPSWDRKEKDAKLWIEYGKKALRELLRHQR